MFRETHGPSLPPRRPQLAAALHALRDEERSRRGMQATPTPPFSAVAWHGMNGSQANMRQPLRSARTTCVQSWLNLQDSMPSMLVVVVLGAAPAV